jgi:hypothetical protein
MRRSPRLMSAFLAGALAALPPNLAVEFAVSAALVTPLFLVAMHGENGTAGVAGGARSPDRLKTRDETPVQSCLRVLRAQGDRGIVAEAVEPDGTACRVAQLYV